MPAPDDFLERFVALEQRLSQLEQRSPFANSGLSVTAPGELTMSGDFIVEGDFIAQGKVSNAALQAPVVPFVDHQHTNNFPVSPAPNVLAPIDVPVPTGFSRALVTCTAVGNCFNTSGALDFMSVFAVIEGDLDVGYSSQRTIADGELETAAQTSTALLEGLSGSFRCYGRVNVQTQTIAANVANVCNVDVTVTFLR